MGYKLLWAIVLLALVGCADTAATEPATVTEPAEASTPESTTGQSGIEGQALIGPTCPVEQEGMDCSDQPYQATATIFDESGNALTTFETGSDGRFEVVLEPGRYTLEPETGKPFPQASSQEVVVRAGEFTEVTILFDNGIR
jgi:hypothetical protein